MKRFFRWLQRTSAESRLRALGVCPMHLADTRFVDFGAESNWEKGFYVCDACALEARDAAAFEKRVEIEVLTSEVQRLRA